MFKLNKKRVFLGGLALILGYDALTEEKIILRNLNTIRCGLKILYNYKIRFNANNYLEVHEDVAKDIYETCMYNDGLYIKMGQGMAASDHVLPPPFFKHLSKLQDKAKFIAYDKISKVFEQDEGRTLEESFQYFEKQPTASASIAQVHQAYLKDGTKVAVKIQKPNIKKQFYADMMMHKLVLYVLEYAFELPLVQFAEPIQRNLEKEVNFNIEASNGRLAAENFRKTGRKDLYVPKIYDEFTKERVLVTEWIDGIKITNDAQLQRLGFNKNSIIKGIISAFAEQIFITGFVHCDPHPGNIFVRAHPQNPSHHQIVIIDHGLCIPISEKFRLQYCKFWKAIFMGDTSTMRSICREWGLTFTDTFASAQLLKPYDPKKAPSTKTTSVDVMKAQLKMKEEIKSFMKSDSQFPEELIFIGRNMNIIRSLNKHFQGNVDRVSIMAETAVQGINVSKDRPSFTFKSMMQLMRFRFTMLVLGIYNWYLNWSGSSVDDVIDSAMLKKQENMFEEYGFKAMDQMYNA